MKPMRFTCPAHNLGHEVLVKLKNYFLKKKSTYAGYLSFFKKNIFYNMYYSLLQLSEFQEANINFTQEPGRLQSMRSLRVGHD